MCIYEVNPDWKKIYAYFWVGALKFAHFVPPAATTCPPAEDAEPSNASAAGIQEHMFQLFLCCTISCPYFGESYLNQNLR